MNNSKELIEFPSSSISTKRRKKYEVHRIYDELLIDKHKYRKGKSMSRKPKVFVVNKGMHNYEAARKYGELVYLSDELNVKSSAAAIYRQFTDILVEESCPTDYLLGTGLAFLVMIATAVFSQLHGRVNALIYNKAMNSYTALPIQLPEHIHNRAMENASKHDCVTP